MEIISVWIIKHTLVIVNTYFPLNEINFPETATAQFQELKIKC